MKYKCETEPRHSYNLLVIRPAVVENENEAFTVIGTLRFANDELGNKAKDIWQEAIQRLET